MKLHFLGGGRSGTVCAMRAHVFVSLVRTSKATWRVWVDPINTLIGGDSLGAKGGVYTRFRQRVSLETIFLHLVKIKYFYFVNR